MHYTVLRADEPVTSTLEVRRSVFLTTLARVEDEDAARAVIDSCRRAHRNARHHVTAFVLGPRRQVQRSSDDGEPAGTAGVPTLEALTRFEHDGRSDLSDVVAVTTRWFGGIKLGAGGLVRAYSDAVCLALGRARLVTCREVDLLTMTLPISSAGADEAVIRGCGVDVTEVGYAADAVHLTVAVASGQGARSELTERLSAALARQVSLRPAGTTWREDR
ncbi:IMPACT family protein [Acidipropionibacterium timonense]|uniref:IMPACT family protein n=1 Tax=Acidipropionibacterium timonense TaxID=2161818 RepID=UPI00102F4A8A|nr:YigZ family protein [Acidipropionibacterium timonense]